jgi:sporulation protein YlmC with PRC-barrel domain
MQAMTDNIVSTISRFLTPELLGKMASASGLDRSVTQKATAAAVPAILSGLAGLVSRPAGARQLAGAVAEQPNDLLGNISSMLGGSTQMADKGGGLLSSLLGSGVSSMLASTVGRFLGIGEGPMRTLMGLLTPVIMGVLGREQRAGGLDTNGLARMLTGQKEEIAAAMPAGLNRLLESSGVYEDIGSSSSDRHSYEAPRTYDAPRSAAVRMTNDMQTTSRGATWPYWVLPLLALGGLLWYLFPRDERVATLPTTQTPSTPSRPVADPPTKLTYLTTARDDWSSIGSSANEYTNQEVYNTAGENLGTIKDLLIGPDGKAAAAIINVGRILGIGEKEIAVPFSAIRSEKYGDGRRIVVDATKEAVQAAPTFARRKQ